MLREPLWGQWDAEMVPRWEVGRSLAGFYTAQGKT